MERVTTQGVTMRKGADGIERVALQITSGDGLSVDVLSAKGTLIMRLNLFDFASYRGEGAGDVDVVLNAEGLVHDGGVQMRQRGTAIAFTPRSRQRLEVDDSDLFAVDVRVLFND